MTALAGPEPAELRSRFETATVDPAEFDHRAHLLLAWDYVNEYGTIAALERFSSGLRHLTKTLGIEGKYHETVTGFLILTIGERMQLHPGESFEVFAQRNTDLVRDVRGLLLAHYSPERLDSSLARRQFLLPDRATREARRPD